MENANELVLELEDFNGRIGKCAEEFEGIQGGYGQGWESILKKVKK